MKHLVWNPCLRPWDWAKGAVAKEAKEICKEYSKH